MEEETEEAEEEECSFPGLPPTKRQKAATFKLEFVDKEWIRKMCCWAERHRITDQAFLELFQELVIVGRGNPEEITLSDSTVRRLRKDERLHASLSIDLADYDDVLCLHFDGKRVKMGSNQGGEVIEHLAIYVTGISGTRQIGIVQAKSSTGIN